MIPRASQTLQRYWLRVRVWLRSWLRRSRRSGRRRCISATFTTSATTGLIALTTTRLRSDILAAATATSASAATLIATATTDAFQFFRRDDAIPIAIETAPDVFRQTFHFFLVDDSIAVAIKPVESTATTIGTRRVISFASRRGSALGIWTTTATEDTFQFFRGEHSIPVGIGRLETTTHPLRQTFQFFLVDHSIAVAIEPFESTATPFGSRIVSPTPRSRPDTAASQYSLEFFTGDGTITVGIGFADPASQRLGHSFQFLLVEHSIAVSIEAFDQSGTTSTSTTTIIARSRGRIISGVHHRGSRRSRMILTRSRSWRGGRIGLGILGHQHRWQQQHDTQCQNSGENTHQYLLLKGSR